MGCIHGMLSVSADSTQKAHAADFLVALGECCQVPGDGARSRATIVLKKFLRSVFGPRLGECVQVATEMLKLFRCLLSLADQHKTLATAAWQALMGAHKMPGGIQTTLTSAKQASWIQVCIHRVAGCAQLCLTCTAPIRMVVYCKLQSIKMHILRSR